MKKVLLPFALLFFSIRFFCEAQCPTLTPFIQAIPNTIYPCHGSCNGMLVINPVWIFGTPPYTFTSNYGTVIPDSPNPGWTTITNLCAGQLIIVNVTDAAGCTGMDGVTLIEPDLFNPTITVTPSCGSLSNGSVTISNIPLWYFMRYLTVSTTDVCSYSWCPGLVASTQFPMMDQSTIYTVDNLAPGNYYFGISFEMTEYQYPYLSCNQIIPFTIPVSPSPSASITPNGPITFCSGGSVVLNVPAGANKSYQWKKGGVNISGATLSSYTPPTGGNYKVTVTNTVTGCSKTSGSATTVTINPLPAATITPQGPTTFCAGGSVVLAGNTGTGLTYKWKKGSNFISGATLSNYTAAAGANYRVQVTNSNGCSKTSSLVAVSVPCKEGEVLMPSGDFNVSVFPNPANAEINIELSSADNFEIEIANMLGERVIKEQNQSRIDISMLGNGFYFIKIFQGNNFFTEKFIKQ